jgi:hypothetical protein
MNNFGKIKTKILKKLTESYSSQNKTEMKTILKTIKENKDFTEMYLFYEEIEGKYFEDKDTAKLYVEELNSILKNKSKNISKFCNSLNEKLGDLEINENELYSTLDNLLEDDTLSNIDKKVIAKKKLVEHLTTKKEIKESENETYTSNENLLHAVLANNFNVLYTNNLSEGQKEELKNILTMTNDDLELKTNELKESILNKVSEILNESTSSDPNLTDKLNGVQKEVKEMETSKYNFYRLTELKNGLI